MLGLLDPGGEDNVYEQLLAKINKNKLSADILTVTVVEALSKLVYVAKSKYDKAPPNMLSKRQFAHVLGYICRREMLKKKCVRWAKNVLCFHQLLCQTLLTCPNGAKTTKICIKVPNYAYKCKNMHTNAKMQIREEVTLVKM